MYKITHSPTVLTLNKFIRSYAAILFWPKALLLIHERLRRLHSSQPGILQHTVVHRENQHTRYTNQVQCNIYRQTMQPEFLQHLMYCHRQNRSIPSNLYRLRISRQRQHHKLRCLGIPAHKPHSLYTNR